MRRFGLIINPVAGIGGKVGLKGSDGEETYRRALELGAVPESGSKAMAALDILAQAADSFTLYACAGQMGADWARRCGIEPVVIGETAGDMTRPQDTIAAAKAMAQSGAELILFAGGDGTARNIMDAVGETTPVLGIPTGCKIHSAVFALTPGRAGEIARRIAVSDGAVKLRQAEVMDIDEKLFREGVVQAKLYGYMKVPDDGVRMQSLKSGRGLSEGASLDLLSNYIADSFEPDTLYILGSGSTLMAIKGKIGIDGTLLGVDAVYNKELVRRDATESQLIELLDMYPRVKLIVTVIGGQGYVFGRGNQQLSAAVLRRIGKQNITIAMTRGKADTFFMRDLYIDTSDEQVNKLLCGYYRVTVGYDDYVMFKAVD